MLSSILRNQRLAHHTLRSMRSATQSQLMLMNLAPMSMQTYKVPGLSQNMFSQAQATRFFSSSSSNSDSELSDAEGSEANAKEEYVFDNISNKGSPRGNNNRDNNNQRNRMSPLQVLDGIQKTLEEKSSIENSRDFGRFVSQVARSIGQANQRAHANKEAINQLATEIKTRFESSSSCQNSQFYADFTNVCFFNRLGTREIGDLRRYLQSRIMTEFKKETLDEYLEQLNLYDLIRLMQIYKTGQPIPIMLWQRLNTLLQDRVTEKHPPALTLMLRLIASDEDHVVRQQQVLNQVCRHLTTSQDFIQNMDYSRKANIFEQLCLAQGSNLVTRSTSATSKLIESLANLLRESIHKIEEQGVFSILRGASHLEHTLSNDRTSRAVMRLTNELNEFVNHMLKENEEMVSPNFIIEYQNATSSFGRIKMQPRVDQRKAISGLLRKKLEDAEAIEAFKGYNNFSKLLKGAVRQSRTVPEMVPLIKNILKDPEMMARITLKPDDMILIKILSSVTKDEEITTSMMESLKDKQLRSHRVMAGHINSLSHYPPSEIRDSLTAKYLEEMNIMMLNNQEVCDVIAESCKALEESEHKDQMIEKLVRERLLNPEDTSMMRLAGDRLLQAYWNIAGSVHPNKPEQAIIRDEVLPELKKRIDAFPINKNNVGSALLKYAKKIREDSRQSQTDLHKVNVVLNFFNEYYGENKEFGTLQNQTADQLRQFILLTLNVSNNSTRDFKEFSRVAMRTYLNQMNEILTFKRADEQGYRGRQQTIGAVQQNLLDAKRMQWKMGGQVPNNMLNYFQQMLTDTTFLKNGGYEADLYSKVITFIGFNNVNRNAMSSVREYLYSENFDKNIFMNSIKEESDPLELSAKLALLKFFVKVDEWDREKSNDERVCTKSDLNDCYEVALTLGEEIVETASGSSNKKHAEFAKIIELLFSIYEFGKGSKENNNRLNNLFAACYQHIDLDRANRQILDTFYDQFAEGTAGQRLKSYVVSRSAMRQFMLTYGEQIANGELQNIQQLNKMFRLYCNMHYGIADFDNSFISAFGNQFDDYRNYELVNFTESMRRRGLAQTDIFKAVSEKLLTRKEGDPTPTKDKFSKEKFEIIYQMMSLGMTETEEFSEVLANTAKYYECDFTELVSDNLEKTKQIDMLFMIFANSAEDNLTWWRKLADSVNELKPEQIDELTMGQKRKLKNLKQLIHNKDSDSTFMTQVPLEIPDYKFRSQKTKDRVTTLAKDKLEMAIEINKQVGPVMMSYYCDETRTGMLVTNSTMRVMGSNTLLPIYRLSLRLLLENEETKDITLKFANQTGALNRVGNSEEGISTLKSLFSRVATKPEEELVSDTASVGDEEVVGEEVADAAVIMENDEEKSVGQDEAEADKKD